MTAVDELTKAELQEQAMQLGVSTAGTKADIAARIEQAANKGRCPHCRFKTQAGPLVLALHKQRKHGKET